MLKLIARRVALAVPLIIAVTFVVFVLIDLAPGDPATTLAGENPDPARVQFIREQLRLDDPVPVRWANWAADAVRGDLGVSLQTQEPVADVLRRRLGVTLSLLLVAFTIAGTLAAALGVVAALKPRGPIDRAVTVITSVAIAMPPFWVGMLLAAWLAVGWGWFPAVGYTPLGDGVGPWLDRLVLPGVALALFLAAELTLQLKGALTEVLGRDYIVTAEAKGLSRGKVLFKHALKNAAVPVTTVAGLRVAGLIGGTATVESVFGLRGIGELAVGATLSRDVGLMLGILFVTVVMVQIVNLVVDILYGYLNPKVRT